MIIEGLVASVNHCDNGMTRDDMLACSSVASRLNEVIIFRSTGPWSKRWLEKNYPSKNFHVKGKSSDWGPHAGLVPYNGIYSKVGANASAADKGTHKNNDGIKSGYAGKQPLVLTEEQINEQLTKAAGTPAHTAITKKAAVQNSKDFILLAKRSGDNKEFAFRAINIASNNYAIHTYDASKGTNFFKLVDATTSGPLEVMTSREVGAGKPMTGDYDLMAICPSWASFGGISNSIISKPGINLQGKGLQLGQTFSSGSRLDKVLDMRVNTGAVAMGGNTKLTGEGLNIGQMVTTPDFAEHPDMGNLTPRILRCINGLNAAMGAVGEKAALRRVHHNAESHRHNLFGAITGDEMTEGEALPLTAFQPNGKILTIETLAEFKQYAAELHQAGYYVPKNWVWGMSIRNKNHSFLNHLFS